MNKTTFRPRKKWAAVLCAAAAAVCLTVTVGAVNGGFAGFFESVFGKSAENLNGNLLDPDSFTVVKETFDDYDCEVVGLAADNRALLAGIRITALNGARLDGETYSFPVLKILNGDGSLMSITTAPEDKAVVNGNEKTYMYRFAFDEIQTDGEIRASLSFKNMYETENGDPGNFTVGEGPETGKISEGEFEIAINLKKSDETAVEGEYNIAVPMQEYIPGTSGCRFYEKEMLISGISISSINITYSSVSEENSPAPDVIDKSRIFVLLDNGGKVGVSRISRGGSNSGGMTYYDNILELEEPVDLSKVKTLIIGDAEISVNK